MNVRWGYLCRDMARTYARQVRESRPFKSRGVAGRPTRLEPGRVAFGHGVAAMLDECSSTTAEIAKELGLFAKRTEDGLLVRLLEYHTLN